VTVVGIIGFTIVGASYLNCIWTEMSLLYWNGM
jgi:hypothetical protein